MGCMRTQDQVFQVNTSLPMFTGIPEDVIVNTFHLTFEGSPPGTLPTVTDYGKVFDRLKTFYDGVYAVIPRANYTTNLMTMKAYQLDLPLPHVPALTGTRTLSGPGTQAFVPTEVSICLSMRAAYIGGVNQARQRGRIFLGGLANPVDGSTVSSFPTIGSTQRTGIATAASNLRTGLITDGWQWVILSAAQVAEVRPNTFPVAAGWIDNSPDTQRRRSVNATARTAW